MRWPEIGSWAHGLPAAIEGIRERWQLETGPAFEPGGATAWVAPARTAAGDDVVLKVGFRHPEAEHEAAGLRCWDGRGAVRLLRHETDGSTAYLLLERCVPGSALGDREEPEQDEVIAALLRRAWSARPEPGVFRPLSSMAALLAAEVEASLVSGAAGDDPGLAREALSFLRECPGPSNDDVLLVGDLHAENVLSAEREPWLLVDPKPYVGDPAYDVTQHLLNSDDRLVTDPLGLVARMAALADVDPAAVRRWTFARLLTDDFRGEPVAAAARALAD